jgi:hypothetical protein
MLTTKINNQLTEAIRNRQIITFIYEGLNRGVEPFTLGNLHNGRLALSGFQITGRSQSGGIPNWRLFDVAKISHLEVHTDVFTRMRPGYNRRDSRMSRIITTV